MLAHRRRSNAGSDSGLLQSEWTRTSWDASAGCSPVPEAVFHGERFCFSCLCYLLMQSPILRHTHPSLASRLDVLSTCYRQLNTTLQWRQGPLSSKGTSASTDRVPWGSRPLFPSPSTISISFLRLYRLFMLIRQHILKECLFLSPELKSVTF